MIRKSVLARRKRLELINVLDKEQYNNNNNAIATIPYIRIELVLAGTSPTDVATTMTTVMQTANTKYTTITRYQLDQSITGERQQDPLSNNTSIPWSEHPAPVPNTTIHNN